MVNVVVLILAGVWTWLPPAGAASRAARPAFELDRISANDEQMLMQTARRAFDAAVMGRAPLISTYRPASLRATKARAYVAVRWRGQVIAQATSGEVDVLDAVRTAAEAAMRATTRPLEKSDEALSRLGMTLELAGPDEFLRAGLDSDLHFEPELYAAFDPGVDGVGVELKGRTGRVFPSVILSSGYSPTLALQHAEKDAGFTTATKAKQHESIRYFRFPTVHLWQSSAFAEPVRLFRGVVRVPPESVSAAGMDRAMDALAAHVRRMCRKDAWFAYEYVPSSERYSEKNSIFGQFQSAWGLGRYGQARGSRECAAMAARLVAAAQSFVLPLSDELPAKVLVTTRDAPPLASTALYLAALTRFPSRDLHQPGAPIADAIRLVQDQQEAAGRFNTNFPPDPPSDSYSYAAGLALLGLAEYAGDKPNDDVDRALRMGVRFYRNYFAKLPTRDMAAWMIPAMSAAYQRKPDPPVSDFMFEMADWLVRHQVVTNIEPELAGAIVDREGSADAFTGRCLVGLADALAMARRLGDRERTARYESAVRQAARFVMQLQFRPAECYYVGGPDDLVGGVRASLWDHAMRVDDSAMALWGLARARVELFGPFPRKR